MKATINYSNLAMVIGGAILMCVGLYRTAPIKIDKAFWLQNGPLAVLVLIAGYILSRKCPEGAIGQWVNETQAVAGRFFLLMALLCIVMAIGKILAAMYKPQIREFLTDHHLLAPLFGSLIAPTPSAGVPIIEELWSNRTFRPMFLYFLQAASLMSFPLFMLRQLGFKNMEICTHMYVTGCIIALTSFVFMRPLFAATEWVCKLIGK